MSPTRRTTLGLQGHRPGVGNLDRHELTSAFGALNLGTGRLPTRLGERGRAQGRRGKTPPRQRHMQAACARHLRGIGRAYPAARDPQVGLVIDQAPWHRGGLITKALAQVPQLRLDRWPRYRPQLQVIARVWNVVRRRATHNRPLLTLAQLTQALRNSLCYDHTLKHRVRSWIQSPQKRTPSTAA